MCCLWGMLSLHTAMEGFRNRYKGVGHGNCGRMQPAVAVQQRVHSWYEVEMCAVVAAAVYCKPTKTVQREAYVPELGSDTEPWYWSRSPASENKWQNAEGEVRKACDGMRRTAYSVHRLLFQVRCQRREQPVCGGHDVEDVLSC